VLLAAGLERGAAAEGSRSLPQTRPADSTRPYKRVLLVSIDTARRDRFAFHADVATGGPHGTAARTPVIDGLARSGAVCTHAYAPTPVTLPSHTSLFTGLYPPRHGIRDNARFRLGPEPTLLAERFQAAGFRTAAFLAAFVLDGQFGLGRGFDVYDDEFQSGLGGMPGREERDAAAVTERVLRWCAAMGEQPWFVFLHYFDAHHPYAAPAPYSAEGVDPYNAELAYVDAQLGRVLAALRAKKLFDDTLIVITADHGESLGEHGEATHGIFVYDSTLAVPLVFHGHTVAAAGRIELPTSLVDVAPTILDLAGLPALEAVHGRSLAAGLTRPAAEPSDAEHVALAPRPVYAESFVNSYSFGWSPLIALIEGPYKFILAPRPELYNLSADPDESENLAAARPADVQELATRVERWYRELSGDGAPSGIAVDLTDEERARIGALGYGEGAGSARAAERGAGRDPKDGLAEFRLLQRAGLAHESGDLAGALAVYDRILAQNPRNAVAAERSGLALLGLQRFEEGIARLASIDLFPGSSMFSLAQAYAQVGDIDRTLALITELRRRNPKFMPAHLFFAQLHEGLDELEEARRAYRELLEHWHGDEAYRRQIEAKIEALKQ